MCQNFANLISIRTTYLGSGLKEMAVFEIFLLFMYHCVVKSSVCSVPTYDALFLRLFQKYQRSSIGLGLN